MLPYTFHFFVSAKGVQNFPKTLEARWASGREGKYRDRVDAISNSIANSAPDRHFAENSLKNACAPMSFFNRAVPLLLVQPFPCLRNPDIRS